MTFRTLRPVLVGLALVLALVSCSKSGNLVTPAAPPAAPVSSGLLQPASPPQQTAAQPSLPAPTTPEALPTTLEGWIGLGNTRMDAGAYAEAINAYSKALELDPSNVDVRVDLGTCYRGVGQSERAIEEYRKALAINPQHPNAHRNSGVVLAYDLQQPIEGAKEFELYLKYAPKAQDAVQILQTIKQLRSSN